MLDNKTNYSRYAVVKIREFYSYGNQAMHCKLFVDKEKAKAFLEHDWQEELNSAYANTLIADSEINDGGDSGTWHEDEAAQILWANGDSIKWRLLVPEREV